MPIAGGIGFGRFTRDLLVSATYEGEALRLAVRPQVRLGPSSHRLVTSTQLKYSPLPTTTLDHGREVLTLPPEGSEPSDAPAADPAIVEVARSAPHHPRFVPPAGFEPAHPAPEAGALSPELRGRRG